MRLAFHEKVASDILRIIGYYEEIAGQRLAEELHAELRSAFQKAAESPETFAIRTQRVPRPRGGSPASPLPFTPAR